MNHAHKRQQELHANILSMYSNKEQLTTKEMSVEEFQKSYPEEDFVIITDDVMKSYVADVIEKAAPIAVATEREKISEKHSFTPEQHKKYGEYYKNAEKEHGHNSEDLGGEKADKIFHSQAKKSFGKDYGNFKKWHENYGNENTTNSEATGR
jgi:hypothetical protein